MRITYRRGVGDNRAHLVVVDSQRLGRHDRHRGARAADVGAAGRDDDRTVLVDVHGGARFAATVEPIAGGDAAPLVLAERRRIARMVEQRLDGVGISVVRKLGAGEHLGPLFGGVLEPQLQRVHADLLRQNIEHALHREVADRRARRAIGRDLRAVAHYVVTDRARIRDVVRSKRAYARAHERRARKGAGLQLEEPVGGDNRAVALDADLHGHRRTGSRAGRPEHVLPAHDDLHWTAGFAREHDGYRFDIDYGLAAKRPADLRRIDAQVAIQQLALALTRVLLS